MAKSPTWNETPRAERAWNDPKRGKMPGKMDVEAEGAEDQARALQEQRRGAAGERSAE